MSIGWIGLLQIITGIYFFSLIGTALVCLASKEISMANPGVFVFHMAICGGLIGFLLI